MVHESWTYFYCTVVENESDVFKTLWALPYCDPTQPPYPIVLVNMSSTSSSSSSLLLFLLPFPPPTRRFIRGSSSPQSDALSFSNHESSSPSSFFPLPPLAFRMRTRARAQEREEWKMPRETSLFGSFVYQIGLYPTSIHISKVMLNLLARLVTFHAVQFTLVSFTPDCILHWGVPTRLDRS